MSVALLAMFVVAFGAAVLLIDCLESREAARKRKELRSPPSRHDATKPGYRCGDHDAPSQR